MIVGIITAILLVIGIVIVLIVKKKSDVIYQNYIEPLDADEFKLKNYIPIGLYLSDTVRISSRVPDIAKEAVYRYNSSVKSKVTELHGVKYSDYYMEIHTAQKWLLSIVGFICFLVFSEINCLNSEGTTALICLIAAPIAAIGLPFLMDKGLDNKIEERRTSIMIEFPEFINKLVLLVNAGMTISKAWEKITQENKKKSPLYDELSVSLSEIKAGKSEAVAYEEFARRCKVKEIIKFVSVIVLNLKKGGSEVVPALRAQSDECWEMRKATARRLGEKASSKLMLPMAIMLVGIIMIVALPAVLALSGI